MHSLSLNVCNVIQYLALFLCTNSAIFNQISLANQNVIDELFDKISYLIE